MQSMYYIGLDVHKRTISYCVKDGSGTIHAEGTIPATRFDLDRWMRTLPQPWTAAMEATVFTGWIYDHLQPHARALKVAHPLMLRAIAAAKKKNDRRVTVQVPYQNFTFPITASIRRVDYFQFSRHLATSLRWDLVSISPPALEILDPLARPYRRPALSHIGLTKWD